MTNLELIATVRTHLLQQGVKSINPTTLRCLYRGPNGTKCAIGCLIPDDKYEERFEKHGFSAWPDTTPGSILTALRKATGLSLSQLPLAGRLQAVHDHYPVEEWVAQLDSIETEERASTPNCAT